MRNMNWNCEIDRRYGRRRGGGQRVQARGVGGGEGVQTNKAGVAVPPGPADSSAENPEKGMKRGNVFNLLLNMMPTAQQPAPTSQPDHWAFLDQVDAPQWVDLAKEAALMGTLGSDDPWFYRSHAHHETSLARVGTTALAVQSTSLREKVRPPTIKKRNSAAVTKPKSSVKACLGSMKRISIVGLKEDRLSNRPRLGTSPRAPGKRALKGGIPRGRVAIPGSDSRSAVYEPAGTPRKRLLQAKLADPSVNSLRPSRSNRANRSSDFSTGRNDRSSQGSDPSVSRTDRLTSGSDPSLSDQSLCNYDSPIPALSTPAEDYRHACVLSSSDMTFCSSTEPSSTEPSPTPSASFAEGRIRLRASAQLSKPKGKIVARNLNAQSFSRQARSTIKDHESSASAKGVAGLEIIKVQEPSRDADSRVELYMEESKTSNVSDRDMPNGDAQQIGKSPAEITQQSTPTSTPSSTPRLKRKSLGSRVKQDGSGPPSSKKNGFSNSVLTQELVLPDKLYGSQATHPILEKLRRSWGSALRVKQRREAEANCASSTGDNLPHNSSALSVGEESSVPSGARSESSVNFEATVIPASLSVDSERGKSAVQIGSDPRAQHTVDPAVNFERLETQSQGEKISPRPESSTVQVTKTSRAAPGKLNKSKSLGSAASRERASSTPAKSALAQLQKSKTDVLPKSKKPVTSKELLTRTSLPKKGNKENLSLELSDKSMTASLDTDRKKRVPNPLLRTSTPTSTTRPQASGNSTASSQVSFSRTNPSARTSPATTGAKTAGSCRSRSLPSSAVRETETSRKSSEAQDRKVSSSAVLRGSASSVPTITKQKSEKFTQVQVPFKDKDSTTAAVPLRAGKSSSVSSAPDEPSGYTTENERKNRLSVQYEPRIHPAKFIREWESKSGKRYYDLQPGERQKVNQEITAAKEMAVSN
ncbi:hypothetical protein R1flu_000997 [Riccia fluitans]|uniref:Uncharacterized protein n=1 Tax=Riccia fluitans TaxID=41844 RepID=A0ABD1Y571_9MARC